MRFKYSPICGGECARNHPNRSILHFRPQRICFVVALIVIILLSLYFGGIFTSFYEEDFEDFVYPLEIDNFRDVIHEVDNNISAKFNSNSTTNDVERISYEAVTDSLKNVGRAYIHPLEQFKDFEFTIDVKQSCSRQWGRKNSKNIWHTAPKQDQFITVIIVVKTAVTYYAKRQAIRGSWYLNKTLGNFKFKTVFMVGSCHENNPEEHTLIENGSSTATDCNTLINNEALVHGDIIQSSGIDSYYNNTIKTAMTLRWLSERCTSDFALAIDDDFVFEVENFISYLDKLASKHYPEALTELEKVNDLRKLSLEYIYAGYLRNYVHPHRHITSKWYIDWDGYKFNKYPRFITGGDMLMSAKTVRHFYLATFFTSSFKFDDVYVGILAHKLGVVPIEEQMFMCSYDDYIEMNPVNASSTSCIGVHEIEPDQLLSLWNQRRQLKSELKTVSNI